MTTLDALQFIWAQKSVLVFPLFLAVFLALCACPEFVRQPPQSRRRALRTLAGSALILLVPPCIFAVVDRAPFWDALLVRHSRMAACFLWGLAVTSATIVIFFAELTARERARAKIISNG